MHVCGTPLRRLSLRLAFGHRALRAIIAFLAVAALTAAPGAAGAAHHRARRASRGCANANRPVGSISVRAIRTAVVCLVNRERATHGLPRLHASPLLNRSAQGWTNYMAATGFFSHGADFAARISAVGFNWSTAGENIATGYRTPRAVVAAWMRSPGHCHNILAPNYRAVGTGVSRRGLPGYGAGTWTQDFALPMGKRAPSGNWGPASGCPY